MYGFKELMRHFEAFKAHGAETGAIGKTELGADIPYVFCGTKGSATLVVVGATHAREHITAKLAGRALRLYRGTTPW